MVDKVTAFQTVDGKLFLDKAKAEDHQRYAMKATNRKQILIDKEDFIRQFALDDYNNEMKRFGDDPIDISKVGKPFYEDHTAWHGWDCENKDNPSDKCIYAWIEDGFPEQCCVFCGDPEEQK
jgi:hypothetical protein